MAHLDLEGRHQWSLKLVDQVRPGDLSYAVMLGIYS